MIEKIKILVMALLLVFCSAVIAGAETASSTMSTTVKQLSLEEALKLAEQNNSAIKNARLGLREANIKASQARNANDRAQDVEKIMSSYDFQGLAWINNQSSKEQLEVAKKSYDVAHELIKLNIKKKYYDVLEKQDTVEIKKLTCERAQKQLDIANANFTVGSVAKTDVLQAQMGLANAEAELVAAQNNLDLAIIDLKNEIGLGIQTPLQLTTKVNEKDQLGEVDLPKYISEALESRLDIAGKEAAVKVAKITYDTASKFMGGSSFISKLAKSAMDRSENDLAETKKFVIFDITKAYLNVQSAAKSLDSCEKAIEYAKENLRLTELRYQVGMDTGLNLLDASIKLDEMETAKVKVLYQYNLAKMSFETAKFAPINISASSNF